MSNELFEQWALDPKGGGWAIKPTLRNEDTYSDFTAYQVWQGEQKAFTAGIQAERNRLRALVEERLAEVKKYDPNHPKALHPIAKLRVIQSLRLMMDWLSDPQPDNWIKKDRDWKDYPIGTKAKAIMGGHWIKTVMGWKWCNGSTFPTPGGDASGMVSIPATDKTETND